MHSLTTEEIAYLKYLTEHHQRKLYNSRRAKLRDGFSTEKVDEDLRLTRSVLRKFSQTLAPPRSRGRVASVDLESVVERIDGRYD